MRIFAGNIQRGGFQDIRKILDALIAKARFVSTAAGLRARPVPES
jgi:hypothetical protein